MFVYCKTFAHKGWNIAEQFFFYFFGKFCLIRRILLVLANKRTNGQKDTSTKIKWNYFWFVSFMHTQVLQYCSFGWWKMSILPFLTKCFKIGWHKGALGVSQTDNTPGLPTFIFSKNICLTRHSFDVTHFCSVYCPIWVSSCVLAP